MADAIFVAQNDPGVRISGTTFVMTKPGGLAVDDVIVAWATSGNGSLTMTPPAGWTSIVDVRPFGTGYRLYVAWKIADAADVVAANFTFTWSGSATGWWNIFAYRNVLQVGAPVEISALAAQTQNITAANQALVTCQSIVTTKTNARILRCPIVQAWTATDNGPSTEPVGHTERMDFADVEWSLSIQENDAIQAAVGPTGTQDVLITSLDDDGDYRIVRPTLAVYSELGAGGGGIMGGDNPAILQPGRERIERGQKILNPFGIKKRPCMCPMGKCRCL